MTDVRDPQGITNPTVEPDAPSPAILAITSDGRAIMGSVDLKDCDLTGREVFTGVYLTDAEFELTKARADNAAAEIVSHLLGKLPRR